ncbi:Protein of unknown function [Pseudoxanthomonas sp. GM95]|uniref:DUF2840 domain-containing protein n=1 Tax=Pseudoxanthomonas sp. GM95 TaxID=1881043 RepID=UPI0008C24A07|nr:DUF2840 domain-containing protein [Pseudoxanthomonas sp. GM95]SEL95251.1 Protein of unknown function [Pseudoxanthomonas sp. GM95]
MSAPATRRPIATAELQPRPLASVPGCSAPSQLTRAWLRHVPARLDRYLRFGNALKVIRLDRWRRVAVFVPGEVFCRIHWQANDYGTERWQLLVLQACTPLDAAQRIEGVRPGARLLLRAEGARAVKSVLGQIDAIEGSAIAAPAVSPTYWRVLGNRLQCNLALPEYTPERHVAWLARSALDAR